MSSSCLVRSAHGETGTVLLSTLLVLSLMSAVALALLAAVRVSVERSAQLDATAQADLYARGAGDFVASQVGALAGVDADILNVRLQDSETITLPFENGAIQVVVSDGSHCLSLSGDPEPLQPRFEALMQGLGVDPARAARIAAATSDWVDPDSQTRPGGAEDGVYLGRTVERDGIGPHRTANVPFQSVVELRAVDGMDEPLFQTLLPHLCLGTPGAEPRFNINTAR